ncbi:hypothetical protein GEMRC1_001168 [Eukaryota sp. GEM-RC1]
MEHPFRSALQCHLDGFTPPTSPLPLTFSDLEFSIEDQLFVSKGGGHISVLWAAKSHVYHHSRKKKEEKILAIVRHYSSVYSAFLINPMGWRGNKYSIYDVIPITDFPIVSKSSLRKIRDEDGHSLP